MVTELETPIDIMDAAPVVRTVSVADLDGLAEEVAAYHAYFAPLFARSEQRAWAEAYLRGLLVADVPRKNVEAMALRLYGAGSQAGRTVRALQQFIGAGSWDDDTILAAHQRLVDQTLGEDDGVLIVDGSDIPKRGDHSAGAARQWCGATGKPDVCQAGVFLGYASRTGYTLLDRRLYLPRPWFAADHRARWRACAIPAAVPFRRKADLAVAMVEALMRERRVRARWLACDEWYGRDVGFRDRIAATGLWYLAEVPRDTIVWLRDDPATGSARPYPRDWVPPRRGSGPGRLPRKRRLHPESPPPVRVDVAMGHLPAARWQRYRLLEGSKGPLVIAVAALRVVTARDGLPATDGWLLVRRPVGEGEELDPATYKYYLSNAPTDTPLVELVRVLGMRWPIESCFEEGKGELGLDHYEVRTWRGWHHHMTLVLLAHHFLVRVQQRLNQREGGLQPAAAPLPRQRQRHPGAHAGPRTPQCRPDPVPPARCLTPARHRCGGRRRLDRLPATAQSGGLPLTPQEALAPPRQALTAEVSLSY